ncbi:MAG: penicillin-binding protein [Oscillospiraceae bacterium]|nr:penicillin-binding protein [Oscillospiraceae bacterium]
MNRISRRAWALVILIAMLVGGVGFFMVEFFIRANTWVVSPGSPHIYTGTNIGTGTVVDRNGTVLLESGDNRTYSDEKTIRKSTLHWLGDRVGHISAPAVSTYAEEMSGYDVLSGLYSYSGEGGQAVLTLSADIQSVALKAMGDRKGTIAVYNYETGEILCAVTTPTYDPDNVPDIEGDTSGAYEGIYLNRFTQSSYVPGSIFKLVTTAAALDSIDDIREQRFKCSGSYAYGPDKVTCERAHGTLDLEAALAKSCNCAFAQIADQLGAETLEEYVEEFQITQSVSFDGITTVSGNFDLKKAADVEVAWSAIGQHTDLVNPCRYMTFMGAIAGGGKAAQPYIVAQAGTGSHMAYTAETVFSERIMAKEVAEILGEYMANNVATVYGSSNFPGMTVCAKSGTSQLGGGQASNAMFAGFVADAEYPLAFVVVVEGGGYGSATCVPILSKVLAACKDEMDSY